jgi:hypothetical protein
LRVDWNRYACGEPSAVHHRVGHAHERGVPRPEDLVERGRVVATETFEETPIVAQGRGLRGSGHGAHGMGA